MGVPDIVQKAGIKTIPKKKKCKKAKWLSKDALQIPVKRREVKGKGGKERYTHLNAEFQRLARRDKKAFLSNQCQEIEENKIMGKSRDIFKKIRDTKGTFTSLVAQMVKHLSTMRETQVQSLVWENPLEKEMATHSSILAWKIPWMEEPGRLQSVRSQRVGHD